MISLKKTGQDAVVTMSDNGIGISEADQIHIFERFYKADKSRNRSLGGSGLGLSIVKKIVDIHQGSIVVSSKPGQGAEFTIQIPLS
ncbi:Signal-transduction histidine kinase senX3 [compost metagenome]